MSDTPPPYPEHDKLAAVSDKSQAIGEFLEWLPSQGIHLAEWFERPSELRHDPLNDTQLAISRLGTNAVLARYFEIDLVKLEEEKQVMLDKIRELNEIREAPPC